MALQAAWAPFRVYPPFNLYGRPKEKPRTPLWKRKMQERAFTGGRKVF